MKDSELYAQLLGLQAPWRVANVELDTQAHEVRVHVEYEAALGGLLGGLCCAHCGSQSPLYDRREERRWRHLDSCGFTTWLVARVPRVACVACGVQSARVPWSEPHSRFTLAFECFALRVLQACQVQAQAAGLLRLSAGQVHELMQRAVRRGLQRRVQREQESPQALPYLSLDEKSIQAGHHYLTVLSDGQGKRVLEVGEERTVETTRTLLEDTLSVRQRASVQAVAMDMWQPFASACQMVLPQAEIVHDRFHITQYLNEAVDATRRQEHRHLQKEGKASEGKASEGKASGSPLAKTKYVWLKNPENLTPKQRATLEALRDSELETAKVWGFKETFREFFALPDVEQGAAFLDNWCEAAQALGNRALNKVVQLLQAHRTGLLAYLRHRISNGLAESLNSRIQQIKVNARGFRRPANFRVAILFFLGKLDLYPQKTP